VDEENNLLLIRGAVPGATGAYLAVRHARAPKRIVKVQAPPKAAARKKA
jgi:ribosomal protein L3